MGSGPHSQTRRLPELTDSVLAMALAEPPSALAELPPCFPSEEDDSFEVELQCWCCWQWLPYTYAEMSAKYEDEVDAQLNGDIDESTDYCDDCWSWWNQWHLKRISENGSSGSS